MKKSLEKKIYFYGVALLIFLLSFLLDNPLAQFFSAHKIHFLDGIFIFINTWGIYLFVVLALLILILAGKKKEAFVFIFAFAIASIFTEALKIIVARERPFTKFNFNSLGETDVNKSFPSGHASSGAVGIKFFEFNKGLYVFWIILVLIVMFSRVYLGMHYLSDTVAGAIVGYGIGDFSIAVGGRFFNRKKFIIKR